MPFPWIIGTIGALVAAKVIHSIATEDSGGYTVTSGPSREEVKDRENKEIISNLKDELASFLKNNEAIHIFSSENSYSQYKRELSLIENKTDLASLGSKLKKYKATTSEKEKLASLLNSSIIEDLLTSKVKSVSTFVDFLNNKFNDDGFYFLKKESIRIKKLQAQKNELLKFSSELFDHHNVVDCSNEKLHSLALNIRNLINANDDFSVAVCGLLKAGKSSLLNCLIDDYDDKTFSVGVVRETVKNKEYKYQDLKFIDTPGLDANDQDTKEAWNAYVQSSMLLFVHCAERPLVTSEIEILKKLKERRINMAKDCLVVLSQADVTGDKNTLQSLEKEVKIQIAEQVGVDVKVCSVSSKIYKSAYKLNKDKLYQNSGYQVLKDEIKNMKDSILSSSESQIASLGREFNEFLSMTLQEIEKEIVELTYSEKKKQESFVKNTLALSISKYQD